MEGQVVYKIKRLTDGKFATSKGCFTFPSWGIGKIYQRKTTALNNLRRIREFYENMLRREYYARYVSTDYVNPNDIVLEPFRLEVNSTNKQGA